MEDFYSNELIERFEKMLEEKEIYFFDSEEFIEIIEYYLDFADNEFAFKALNIANEQYPDSVAIKIKWLEFYVNILELHKAKEVIEDLKDLGCEDTDFLIAIAQYWSARKNHKMAIRYYEDALKNKEEEDYILSSIGNEYLELNQVSNALDCFLKSIHVNPKDDFTFFSIIHCFEELGRNEDCANFLTAYIDEFPYSETAWFQLGMKQMQLKKLTEAYQSFDFASVINPETVVNYAQKAYCLEELRYWEKAVKVYEEALLYEDNKSFLLLKMAKCFKELKEEMSALKVLKQALKEDPQQDTVLYELSLTYEKLGNYQEALYYIQKAVDLDKENANFLKKQIYLHIKLKLFEEAIQDFDTLLKLEPHRFTTHYAYSELLLSIGEFEACLELLERIKNQFHKAELIYQKAVCLLKMNKLDEARIAYIEALENNEMILSKMQKKYPILEELVMVKTNSIKKLGK